MGPTQWPKDEAAYVLFSDLVDPLRHVVNFAYVLQRQNEGVDIPWVGYDIGNREKATCITPDELFTVDCMKFQDEDQGRDVMDLVLTLAVQLGIEQGRRVERQRADEWSRIDRLTERLKAEAGG